MTSGNVSMLGWFKASWFLFHRKVSRSWRNSAKSYQWSSSLHFPGETRKSHSTLVLLLGLKSRCPKVSWKWGKAAEKLSLDYPEKVTSEKPLYKLILIMRSRHSARIWRCSSEVEHLLNVHKAQCYGGGGGSPTMPDQNKNENRYQLTKLKKK
jgi:hypothetical protein